MRRSDRPLSPHLLAHRFQWNMVLSMLHRVTGVTLGVGTLLLAWWLMAAAAGPESYAVVERFVYSIPGRSVLLGFTFSLFYHLCDGVRHLVWDAGWGFDPRIAAAWGWIVLVIAVVLTMVSWYLGYAFRDSP